MSIIDTAKEWIFGIALRKGVQKAIQAIVALIIGKVSEATLSGMGITVDPDKLIAGGTIAAMGGLEVLRNWLKIKFGLKWL